MYKKTRSSHKKTSPKMKKRTSPKMKKGSLKKTRSIKKKTRSSHKKTRSIKKKTRSIKKKTRSIKKRSYPKMKKRIQKGGNTKDVEAAEAAYKTSKAAYDKKVADNSKALEGIFDKYIKYLMKTQELQKDFSNEVDGEIPTLKFEQFKDYKTVYSKYAKEMEGLINTYIDNEKKYLLKLINDTDYLKDLYSSKVGKTSLLGKLTPKQTAAKQDDEKYAREAALAQAREDASKKA
jgi:hypothetical protein